MPSLLPPLYEEIARRTYSRPTDNNDGSRRTEEWREIVERCSGVVEVVVQTAPQEDSE